MLDPIWNKSVKESDKALDPLGMNRVANRLLDDLLFGITTVSPRARYYSFYVWVIYYINQQGLANNFIQFRSKFCDIERIFMLGCIAHEQDPSGKFGNHEAINGSVKGRSIWSKPDDYISLDFTFLGQELGGYGQYYRGPIANTDLIYIPENATYERPTKIGLKAAKAFDKVAKRSGFEGLINSDKVLKEALIKVGKEICLCRLKDEDSNDREVLRSLFFGFLPEMKSRRRAIRRRKSLSFIMFLSNFAASRGFELTDQSFLDACYFHQMWGAGKAHNINIPSVLDIAERWKVFRAHDYLAFSAESLLSCFLEFLNEEPSIGGTFQEFINRATAPGIMNGLSKLTKAKFQSNEPSEIALIDVIDAIALAAGIENFDGTSESSKKFDSIVNISSEFSEYRVMKMLEEAASKEKFYPQIIFISWPVLMLCVYMRFLWMHLTKNESWQWLRYHTNNDLSPVQFINGLMVKMQKDYTLADFIKEFINDYVIDQARRIYLDKLSKYSKPRSWFHIDGHYYKRDRGYWARHRNTRFESAITILEDLGLIRTLSNKVELKRDGKRLLHKIGIEVD